MPFRSIVLVIATFVVLSALLVLFFQVRSVQEIEIPPEALAEARTQYERSKSGRPGRDVPGEPGPAAAPPRRPPSAPDVDTAAPSGGDERSVNRRPAIRRSVSDVRPAGGDPVMPPSSSAEQDRVRSAYDENDYETALSLGQNYLNQFPGDPYVLRVVGVSACAVGQEDVARKYHAVMTATDQSIVARRCSRYGITLQP